MVGRLAASSWGSFLAGAMLVSGKVWESIFRKRIVSPDDHLDISEASAFGVRPSDVAMAREVENGGSAAMTCYTKILEELMGINYVNKNVD